MKIKRISILYIFVKFFYWLDRAQICQARWRRRRNFFKDHPELVWAKTKRELDRKFPRRCY